ncbi:DUF2268 domain-containing putative Zn-dependent protease [Paracoccus alkanivorans]|nr:DUF2268 domain-containing putative Zn-dependent protease [Paracoccus alkanivorans]
MLNARHGLTRILPEIRQAVREAVRQASVHADLPDFDIVVKADPAGCIPGLSVGGSAPAPGLIEISLDPGRFAAPALVRILVHELHHLIRWDGPGYGKSLGEALVSEGLAGHFVLQVLGGKPDRWDATTPAQGSARAAMNKWSRRDYDHARWFFGSGDLRRWTGYGLGHRLIAEHLSHHPEENAVTLACVQAEALRPVMRRLAGAEAATPLSDEDSAAEAEDGKADEASLETDTGPASEEA